MYLKNDSLIMNAVFLFGILLSGSLLGFLAWALIARLYDQESVGIATSIISVVQLLAGIAGLGMGMGIIRFFTISKDPARLLNSAIIITLLCSALVGVAYISGLRLWSPAIAAGINGDKVCILVIWLLILWTPFSSLLQMIFQAARMSQYALAQVLFTNLLRLPLAALLVSFSIKGILFAHLLSTIVMCIVSVLLLLPKSIPDYRFKLVIPVDTARKIIPYSFGLYVIGLLIQMPSLLSPLFVLEKMGAEYSAKTYVAWMIGAFITSPGQAMAGSAYAEGSSVRDNLPKIIRKANRIGLRVTVVTAVATIAAAPLVLRLFGSGYQDDIWGLLVWFAFSSPFTALYKNGFSIMQIERNIRRMTYLAVFSLTAFTAAFFIAIDFIGLHSFGLSWLISQLILWAGCIQQPSRKKS